MEPVVFKGSRDGITVQLDCSNDFEELCQLLVEKLWQGRDFLGEKVDLVINTGDIVLNKGQELALKILLRSRGYGLKKILPEPQEPVGEKKDPDFIEEYEGEKEIGAEAELEVVTNLTGLETFLAHGATLIVKRNLRSGQRIEFDGTLIIVGDVNPGAVVMATGHILVLGTLRGLAHAGVKGNENAILYANRLQPTQLRIAEFIARAPDGENITANEPEIARIQNQTLIIENYLSS